MRSGKRRITNALVTGLLATVLFLALPLSGQAGDSAARKYPAEAIYQFSVMAGSRRAYLWIPPRCSTVRGVLMAMENLTERRWLEDPIIRQTATAECLGTLWLGSGANAVLTADMKPDAGPVLEKMFGDLAGVSGYPELRFVPLMPMGHSANGHFAWTAVQWDPARIIAAIPIKTIPMPEALTLGDVPLLYVVGETTEWPQYRDGKTPGDRDFFWPVVRDSATALRTANEHNLIGVVTDPGGGHFDWSENDARFVALYIRKACQYRLPASSPKNGPVPLKPLRRQLGWLTDTGGMEPDRFAAMPYAQYKGDPKKAYWFFDEETARAAVAFQGDRKRRQRQMLTFVQDGKALPVAKQGFAALKFEPEPDGITFDVKAGFLQELPSELIGAGTPLGNGARPVSFSVITGPAVQTGPDRFRIQFGRGDLDGEKKSGNLSIWIGEEVIGDDQYRRAVQPGQMVIPRQLLQGNAQAISFPAIAPLKAGTGPFQLRATSDSGLPVRYYVVSGPAMVEGGRLNLTEIPVAARYPIEVTLVAYQWGSLVAPQFQSAPPVERTILVER